MKQGKNQTNKNPKRVEAAKKAAAKRVRIDGKFVTKAFEKKLQKAADHIGFKGDLQTFFNQHELNYSNLYKTGGQRSPQEKAESTVFREMEGRKILMNGEESTEAELAFKMLQLEQWLFSNTNTAGVAWKPKIYFNGKYEVDVPELEELEELFEELDETDAVKELYDRYKIRVWVSPKKREGISRKENKRRNEKIERKAEKVDKLLSNARKRKNGNGRKKR